MKGKQRCFCAAIALIFASTASATIITTTKAVPGTTAPWTYVNGGLNTSFQYGASDGSGPVLVGAGDGFLFAQGLLLTIQYLSGAINTGGGAADSIGGLGTNTATGTMGGFNGLPGTSGQYAPSKYMSPYPVYLGELVGTFADNGGAIVGNPFAVGNGITITIPNGATRFQIGINDDILRDNTGSLQVRFTESIPDSMPEPSTLGFVGVGLLGLLASWRRLRRSGQRSVSQ